MSFLKVAPGFMARMRPLTLPFADNDLAELHAGDLVSLTGAMYTGRDQTHRRLCELIERGEDLPVNLDGQLLYYVGPTPALPGEVIGSAGPTTSYRMDSYTPALLALGLKATMGKGPRSEGVRQDMVGHRAIYLASIGGAGAFLSRCIKRVELIAFEDAGPEAMFRFEVEGFPAVVINDLDGNDFYRLKAEEKREG